MEGFLSKLLASDITYYVVVPIAVVLLGWIKSEHDLKEKNKELGYWMMECRRLLTFPDIAIKNYIMMGINMTIMFVVKSLVCLWKGMIFSYIISGSLYFGLNGLVTFLNCRSANSKVEFWKNGKTKRVLVIVLYLLYGIPFFSELYGKYILILVIIFGILLFAWGICLFNYCDVAFILDNKYADIYIKGSERAQFAEAGSIKKRGEWIIVNRYVNGYDEEIRIKESDIVRIDYYGGPMIMVEKRKLFQKRH